MRLQLKSSFAIYCIINVEDETSALVSAQEALRQGCTALQLRQKSDRAETLRRVATKLRPYAQQANVPIIINDHIHLAIQNRTDGVHLGQRDLPLGQAKAYAKKAERDFVVGISVHTLQQAINAHQGGADYISLSPLFGTATKPDIAKPMGVDGLRSVRRALPKSLLICIGGIKPHHIPMLYAHGADGVAFVSGRQMHGGYGTRAYAHQWTKRRAQAHLQQRRRAPRLQSPKHGGTNGD